jgi:hypothetical protein
MTTVGPLLGVSAVSLARESLYKAVGNEELGRQGQAGGQGNRRHTYRIYIYVKNYSVTAKAISKERGIY